MIVALVLFGSGLTNATTRLTCEDISFKPQSKEACERTTVLFEVGSPFAFRGSFLERGMTNTTGRSGIAP